MTRKALHVLLSVSLAHSTITDTSSLGWLVQQGYVTIRESKHVITLKGTKLLTAAVNTVVVEDNG